MAVSGVNNTAATVQTAQSDGTKLNADFDQFLRLLTTQLQNQDPLSPMDSTEFTNQLVQFSSVEQQIKGNKLTENLISMQTLNMTALGVSFIGKEVEVGGNTFANKGGETVTLSYNIPEDATSGTVSILDKDGEVVYSQNAELETGTHSIKWDGKDNDGNIVDPGTYTIKVGALADKKALTVDTYVPGHVDGLESSADGALYLNVGDKKIPLTDIYKIMEPKA
jgi:flagellar basal-body rod modification protein FlgD